MSLGCGHPVMLMRSHTTDVLSRVAQSLYRQPITGGNPAPRLDPVTGQCADGPLRIVSRRGP
eukprot:2314752-Prymnesium_polylepis.1